MLRTIQEIIYLISILYLIKLYYNLFLNVVKLRRKTKTSIGNEGKELERAIRAHGNFCETVPIILLVSFILYFNNLLILSLLTVIILAFGRNIHAKSISNVNENIENRRLGMRLTFTALLVGVIGIIFYLIQLVYFTLQASINTTFLPHSGTHTALLAISSLNW